MADLSGASDDIQKFIDAMRKATSAMDEGQDLAKELIDNERDRNREIDKEFAKLGLTLEDHGKIIDKDKKSLEDRAKNEKIVNDALKESGKVRADATKAEIDAYKLTQQQNTSYQAQLESMGRTIDEYGKITDTTVRLNKAQLISLAQEAKKDAEHQKMVKGAQAVATGFADFRKALATQALSSAFNLLTAGVMGTYKGMLAMQDALLEGREGETVQAAAVTAQLEEMAGALKSSGEGFVSLGEKTALAAVEMAAVSLPMAGLALALAGLTWLFGQAQKAEAMNIELQAKRTKQQAEQAEKLYDGYQKLSSASMIGSRGLQGLYDDLHKMGLSVSQFEKLNKVLQENQKEIKLFGAGMVDGAKNFSEQAGKLVNSKLGGQLEAMGISQEEQFSHMANFMAQQSRFGQKINGDQSKAAANYIGELDKLAQVTGASRKEQEDARKAIMSINQLRAAMLEAEKKGDTKTLEKLQRAYETSSALYAAGLKEEGGALAKLMAAGGAPTDAETARVQQAMGGKGGAIEMIETGQGSQLDRTKAAASGLQKKEEQFAGTNKYTGGTAGVTSQNIGAIIDLNKSLEETDKAAKKAGMSTDEYLKKQREAADDAKKATGTRRENREKKLATDDLVKAGGGGPMESSNMMMDAATKFSKAVGSWIGGVMDWLFGDKWWEKTKQAFSDMWDKTTEVFSNMWEGTKKMVSNLGDAFGKAYDSGKEMLSDLATSMVPIVSKIGEEVGKAFQGMIDKIIESVKSIIKMIPGASTAIEAGGKAVDTVKGAASSVAGAASSAWGGVTGFFGGNKSAAPAAAPAGGGGGGGAAPAPAPAAAPAARSMGGGGGGGAAAPAAAPSAAPPAGASDNKGQTEKTGGSTPTEGKKSSGSKVSMGESQIKDMIKAHEGFVPYPYKDTKGLWTIGVGHLIGNGKSLPEQYSAYANNGAPGAKGNNTTPVPDDLNKLFDEDYAKHRAMAEKVPMFDKMSPGMQGAFTDLAFNMGGSWWNDWKILQGQIKSKDAPAVAENLRSAKWAKDVGPKRTANVTGLIESGFQAKTGGLFDGPTDGYGVELHGREAVVPMPNPTDKLVVQKDVDKQPLDTVTSGPQTGGTDTIKEIYSMNADVMEMLADKLDTMIAKISDSNDIQSKLLMHSRT